MLLPIDRASDSIIRSIAVLLQNVNLPLCRAATMPPTHQIIKVMRLSLRALAPHLLLAFAEIIVRLDWFRAKLIRSCIYMEGVVSCSWVNIIIINMLVCCLNIYIYTPGGKDRGFLEYWETWPLLRSRRLQRHRGVQSPGGHDHLQFQGSKIIIIIFHYPKKKNPS